jgi:hypothetical protein
MITLLLAALLCAHTDGRMVAPPAKESHPMTAHNPVSPDPLFRQALTEPPRTHPEIAAPEAHWLWLDQVADHQRIRLRRVVELKQAPVRAILHITADDAYRLWVNGAEAGERRIDPDYDRAWAGFQRYDVTRLMRAGRNVVAVGALNLVGPAGVMATLDLTAPDGRIERIVTEPDGRWLGREDDGADNTAWTRPDLDDSGWAGASDKGLLSIWPWNMPDNYPFAIEGAAVSQAHATLHAEHILRPVRLEASDPKAPIVAQVPAAAQNLLTKPEAVLNDSSFVPDWADRAAKLNGIAPSFVLDFGREVAGALQFRSDSAVETEIRVKFGESLGEAEDGGLAMAEKIVLPAKGRAESGESGFRYAKIYFLRGDASGHVRLRPVALDFRVYPVAYRGAFDCSDPLLTRIWHVGAYTAHLCMQEDVWDGAKRDRLRWMGDVNVELPTIWAAFADKALTEQTMRRLRVTGPPSGGDINGIAGYSLFWIVSLRDLYQLTGDRAYLESSRDDLLSLLDFFRGRVNEEGIFNAASFVDWARLTPVEERNTTHLLLCRALDSAAWMLNELKDPHAADIAAWRDRARQAARKLLHDDGTFGPRKHPNAMAILAGVLSPEEEGRIADETLTLANHTVITPYYGDYVLQALAKAGRQQEGLNFLRAYWGEMIRRGATTFWEAFDPHWPAGEEHDFHRHTDVVSYGGYRTSLCHGWASGPTAWLSAEVLGVRPIAPGGSRVRIAPRLGDLTWASGRVPTAHGEIVVRHERHADGSLSSEITLPAGVSAEYASPQVSVELPAGKTMRTVRVTVGTDGHVTVGR